MRIIPTVRYTLGDVLIFCMHNHGRVRICSYKLPQLQNTFQYQYYSGRSHLIPEQFLFRYVTRTSLDIMDFETCKRKLIARGKVFQIVYDYVFVRIVIKQIRTCT